MHLKSGYAQDDTAREDTKLHHHASSPMFDFMPVPG
jgi:hypothetical protein